MIDYDSAGTVVTREQNNRLVKEISFEEFAVAVKQISFGEGCFRWLQGLAE